MHRLRSPSTYLTWSVLAIAALLATRPLDPYLFGLATFVAAGGTALAGVVGLVAVVLARESPARDRLLVAAALLAAGLAVAWALAALRGFRWA